MNENGKKVALFINSNGPQTPETLKSRENGVWPDGLVVVCPDAYRSFLPLWLCRKMKVEIVDTSVSAAQMCRGKPRKYPVCVLDKETAEDFTCLKELQELEIAL